MNKKDEQKLARAKVGSVVPLSNGMEVAVYNAYATLSSCNSCALKHYCINNEKSKERERLRLTKRLSV